MNNEKYNTVYIRCVHSCVLFIIGREGTEMTPFSFVKPRSQVRFRIEGYIPNDNNFIYSR